MTQVATVSRLWRYPVKSMAGEELTEAFMGFAGLYGDRCYAFADSTAHPGFPYLTARVQSEMLRYRPRFREPGKSIMPPNLNDAQNLGPGTTPLYAQWADFALDVVTPSGDVIAIDDPRLIQLLSQGLGPDNRLSLMRSQRAFTDCRPLSLISQQTSQQIESEIDTNETGSNETGSDDSRRLPLDPRRFRANIYLDFVADDGFGEDKLIHRKLQVGSQAVLCILERDPRCQMISLDPDSGELDPEVLRTVAQAHEGYAGVYGAVLVEGIIRVGDVVRLLD